MFYDFFMYIWNIYHAQNHTQETLVLNFLVYKMKLDLSDHGEFYVFYSFFDSLLVKMTFQ